MIAARIRVFIGISPKRIDAISAGRPRYRHLQAQCKQADGRRWLFSLDAKREPITNARVVQPAGDDRFKICTVWVRIPPRVPGRIARLRNAKLRNLQRYWSTNSPLRTEPDPQIKFRNIAIAQLGNSSARVAQLEEAAELRSTF